jgi:hypothetical protein
MSGLGAKAPVRWRPERADFGPSAFSHPDGKPDIRPTAGPGRRTNPLRGIDACGNGVV